MTIPERSDQLGHFSAAIFASGDRASFASASAATTDIDRLIEADYEALVADPEPLVRRLSPLAVSIGTTRAWPPRPKWPM